MKTLINTISTGKRLAVISMSMLSGLSIVHAQNFVGINTTDPQCPLHVWDPGQVPSTLFILGDDTEARLELGFDRMQAKTDFSNLPLLIQHEGGNVGINTSSLNTPQAPLHVWNPGQVPSTILMLGDDTEGRLEVGFNHIQSKIFATYLSLSLQPEGGNVGIGIDNPVSKLHIAGGEDASYTQNGYFMMGTNAGLNLILDDNEILARNNGSSAELFIQRDGGDLLLCALDQGSVGIGVSSTGNMPAGYRLAVDGKAIFEEVRVELSGNWPDYVFGEDYRLMPLLELESVIKRLGHLPGFPSAQQYEREGADLGETQRLMMEKIEELTLYVIELQKEIEALKERAQ